MIKKIFSIITISVIVCFSFYYTELAAVVIKENDSIMKKIRSVSNNYEKEAVNAEVDENSIIPGINGSRVNKNESYASMKRYGTFNESLMVFEEVEPNISINSTYDKFINKGNSNKMMISLLFLIKDYSYVTEILNILDSKSIKATFFIDESIIEESSDIIKLINNSNHQVEVYSNTYTGVKKYTKILNSITGKDKKFCLTLSKNTTVLNNCSNNKMHTILPSIIATNFPYNDVKSKLESGSIIKLDNNKIVLRELRFLINYIKQRGYKIVDINKLVEE